MSTYIFDCECTGFEEPQLIEAAYVQIGQQFHVMDGSQQRYHPSKPISYGAMAVHHILPEELINCPPSSTFSLPEDCEFLIGHNIDFDWNVIGKPDVKKICTLMLARDIWMDLDSRTIGALIYYLLADKREAREELRNAHNAMQDCLLTLTILRNICARLGIEVLDHDALEKLYDLTEIAKIPAYIDFGKHAGKLYEDVPLDYKEWYFRQQDTDPLIVQAMRKPRRCNVLGQPFQRKVW